jgi:RHS repeat-associated protein
MIRSIPLTLPIRLKIILVPVLLFLITSSSFAQTTSANGGSTPSGLTRGNPTGTYSLSGFESINLFNGNLNASLPLLQVGGRGSTHTALTLGLNSKGWRVEHDTSALVNTPEPNLWKGLAPGYGPGVLQGRYGGLQTRRCRELYYPYSYYNVNKYTFTTLTFILPDGTEYELHDQLTGGQPLTNTACNTTWGPSRGTIFNSQDGAGITFISDTTIYDMIQMGDGIMLWPAGYLLFPDGTRYRIDNGRVTWLLDRNGNKMSFMYDASSRVTTITDTLNRQVTVEYDVNDVAPYGLCDRITFKGTNGQQRIIRISKTSLGNVLRTGYSPQSPHDLFPGLDGTLGPYNPTVVSKLWLPNSDGTGQHYQFYQFFYDSYGELARVELPTGGAIEYDMNAGSGVLSGYPSLEIYRRVAERRVYAFGSTLENRTTYSPVQSMSSDAWPWTTTVTVDQLNAAGTLLARSKHYLNGSAPAALTQTPGDRRYIYPAWNEGQEYQVESFAADGATVLRRVNNTSAQRAAVPWWSSWVSQFSLNAAREPACDPRLTQTVSTLVDSNQVSQQTFSYDQFNNQTDAYLYDFGGVLLRRSHTDYVTTNPVNGANYTGTAIYMRGLPAQTSIYDAGGVERARTTLEYDNYLTDSNHAALTNRSGISGFDSAFNTSYTTRGNATATTHYLLVSGSVVGSVTAYAQFDIAGNAVKAIDPRGYATTFDFTDRFGTPNGEARSNLAPTELSSVGQSSYTFATLVTSPPPQTGQPQQTAYAQFDYYTGRPVDGEDANGVVSSGYYGDALDRPTQVIRAANQSVSVKSQTSFAYDDANRTITTTSDLNTNNDNALMSKVLYDGLGRTTETRQYESGSNYIATKQNYDALGRAYQASNPYRPWQAESPVWTISAFDSLSRVTSVTAPHISVATSSYYGNSVTVTDQAGKARKTVSDAAGRLIQVYEDPSVVNYLTSYSYDALNDLTTVSQGVQTRSFVYDSLKRLTSATNPESGTVSYIYDNSGNLLTRTDARSITTTIVYDALNRPTTKSYNDGTPAVAYFYDGQSLPLGAPSFDRGYSTGALVATTYGGTSAGTYRGYDAARRIVRQYQQTDAVNYLVEASYFANSSLQNETYPSVPGYGDRRVVSYTNDGAGRTASLSSNATSFAAGASVASMGYASHNALMTETYGNNLVHAIAYNNRLQANEIKLGTSGNPTSILDLTYNYGTTSNNGSLQSASYTGGGLSYTQTFGYDSLNRLTTSQENSGASWSQTNSYDRYSNRSIVGGGLSFDASTNRITGWSYDAAGNLLNDGVHSYTYDAENKVKTVDAASAYVYDGEGRRVKKLVGENMRFVYSMGGQLVAEFDGSNGMLKKEYVYGGSLQATIDAANGTQYTTPDTLGSPRVVTNASGAVVSRHDYLPFGVELGVGAGGRTAGMGFGVVDGNRKKFTSKERDNETGLDYFEARYYASTQGRFTSVDPENYQAMRDLSDPQSWNAYAYVNNNPLLRVDPDGKGFWDKLKNLFEGNGWISTETHLQREEQRQRDWLLQQERNDGTLYWRANAQTPWTRLDINNLTRAQVSLFYCEFQKTPTNLTQEEMQSAIDQFPQDFPQFALPTAPGGEPWRSTNASRPLNKMGHAAKHLKAFQKIDPNLTESDVAKILEHVRSVGNPSATSFGGKAFEATVNIGGKSVTVKVIESAGGVIKTGYPVP